jgi:hypothetical protein
MSPPSPCSDRTLPLCVACSNRETIHLAAQLGIGALTFAFVDPAEAKLWVDDYYETFKNECVPIGHTVNPNIAMVTSFSVHNDHDEAVRRGLDGFRFFQFALGHHYVFGDHTPGKTNIWDHYVAVRDSVGLDFLGGGTDGIGTPDELRAHLQDFADAGVDQTVFIQQGGNNKHEHICEALELFAAEVMPEFKAVEAERQASKDAEMAPFIEAAFERKAAAGAGMADVEVESFPSYGFRIAEEELEALPEAQRRRAIQMQKLREVVEQAEAAVAD